MNMPSVKKNIIANYAGSFWSALMGLAFVPLYIKHLGMESYGLIGIFASLQTWLALLDLGISPALSREMARLQAGKHTAQSIRELLRSVEVAYFALASSSVVIVWLAAPWLAKSWLKTEHLSSGTVREALYVMGIVVALRWFVGPYRGALMGLQRQVWLNGSNALFATLRGLGVLGVLVWVSATIEAFFIFQGFVAVLESGVLSWKLRRELPVSFVKTRFKLNRLLEIRSYAGGVTAITVLAILLTQIDKIMLSKMLTLTDFGYYSLAGTVAGALYMLISPISTAVLPRLTELHARHELLEFADTYHKASQLLSIVIVPPAVVLTFFSREVMLLWMRDPGSSPAAASLVSMLAFGNMLNGFMYIPYMAQLAHGWTRFTVIVNSIAVIVLVPAIYFCVRQYGTMGAAAVWIMLNAGYVLVAIHFMHRIILHGEKWRWYGHSILIPLSAASSVAYLIHIIPVYEGLERWQLAGAILLALVFTAIVTTLATPVGRNYFSHFMTLLRSRPIIRRLSAKWTNC